jgi:NitT/TauT family transport system permease protein
MSKPSMIFNGWYIDIMGGQLMNDVITSSKPFLFGFIAAAVVGIFIGTMMGWRTRVGYALDPLMTAFYASPLVAVAPLMIIAFGVGVKGKAILVFLLCVFPFVFNTYAGVKSVEQLLVNVVRSMGGSQKDIYLKVIVPSVLPFIIAGARYAIGRALVAILVGEFYAATAGIGFRIAWYSDMYILERMFAYIFTMMVIAVVFTEGIRWAERSAFPWRVGM